MKTHITKIDRPIGAFRWIVINSSGGKDSQTALRVVVAECDRQGIDRARIIVSHQDLGEMEWEGTSDLVKSQAEKYGLRVIINRYRDREGSELSLLDYVEKREKWPSSQQRFCTSEFKRSPGGRAITQLCKESRGNVLNVMGFRAEESSARSKKIAYARNARFSNKSREVMDWLPIHKWSEAEVWSDIKDSNVPYHAAYDLGMSRLSCVFCIFAPKNALMIAGLANPKLLDRYCSLETKIDHTFQDGRSLNSIRDALRNGERPAEKTELWTM